jgi:hypothetical protein
MYKLQKCISSAQSTNEVPPRKHSDHRRHYDEIRSSSLVAIDRPSSTQ